jgi:hypothetical protein
MTKDEALALTYHQTIYHVSLKRADGTPVRARVTGKPIIKPRLKTWWVPVKHGLKYSFHLDAHNVANWETNPAY